MDRESRRGSSRGLRAARWVCWLLPLAAQAQESPQLFVMGDSLSDTGNAAAAREFLVDAASSFPPYTVGLCHPADVPPAGAGCEALFFEKSRVSDGPVAVEHVAAGLGLAGLEPSFHLLPNRPLVGTNYAVASATARGSGVEDLTAQVDYLLLDHAQQAPLGALYVVAIGGNDVLDALQALAALVTDPMSAESAANIIVAAVDAIANNVERLVDSGARYVLVLNAPNIGALPAVREGADGALTRVSARRVAAAVSRTFNTLLWWRLRGVQQRHPAARIDVFDVYTAFELERARAFFAGRNFRDACFDSETYLETGERVFHEDCAPETAGAAPRFDQFVFWDALHPTGRIHAAIGQTLLEAARKVLDAS